MAGCTICKNPSARALIDGAVLGGSTPIDAFRHHGEALGLSRAAIYRHCSSHRPDNGLALSYVGDSLSGDLIADLVVLRRSHVEQRDAAISRGDHTTASREGTAALTASTTLIRAGFTDDRAGDSAQMADRLTRSVQRAARNRPAVARSIADAARELGYRDLADDADDLAQKADDYIRTTSTKGAPA